MSVILSTTAWLTDQNSKELNLRGEELTLTFKIQFKIQLIFFR